MRLQSAVLEGRPELAPEGFLLLTTAIDAAIQRVGTRPVNFRVGAKRVQPRRQVAPVPRFDTALHHPNVLLRHRPRSISRRRGGCHPRIARSKYRRGSNARTDI